MDPYDQNYPTHLLTQTPLIMFTPPWTTSCPQIGPQAQYILLSLTSKQQPLKIPVFCSSGKNEDFNSTTTLLLPYITSVCANTFLVAQHTLLMFRHLRCAFIKFLRLHVPHILRRDGDPTAGDFVGTRAGIFPVVTLFLI